MLAGKEIKGDIEELVREFKEKSSNKWKAESFEEAQQQIEKIFKSKTARKQGDLLGEVLGVVGVAGEPEGEAVDAYGVLPHDLVPRRRSPGDAGVVHRRSPFTYEFCHRHTAPFLPSRLAVATPSEERDGTRRSSPPY